MEGQDLLLVDDDPTVIHVLSKALAGCGSLRFATSGEAALRLIAQRQPDVILLDAQMPGMSGLEVCEAIRNDPELAEIPVIFVTSQTDPEFEVAALEAGAMDFVPKPVRPELVRARVNTQLRLKAATDKLRLLVSQDGLTGLANRSAFDQQLVREWGRALRQGTPLSVLMVDVDYFKRYNDRYGHQDGDECLRLVAAGLRKAVKRADDFVARYGGEEFVLLLPQTDSAGAAHMARQLLEAVGVLKIPHADSTVGPHVSLSVGVSTLELDKADGQRGQDADARNSQLMLGSARLVKAADQALYAAKRAGRGRACSLALDHVEDPGRAQPVAAAG